LLRIFFKTVVSEGFNYTDLVTLTLLTD